MSDPDNVAPVGAEGEPLKTKEPKSKFAKEQVLCSEHS